MASPERMVAGFCASLRAAGVAVPAGSTVTYARALGAVGVAERSKVYWAGRSTLLDRPESIPAYDRVFAAYWDGEPPGSSWADPPAVEVSVDLADQDGPEGDQDSSSEDDDGDDGDDGDQALRFSAVEVLRSKDLSELTPSEWYEAQRIIALMRTATQLRPTRRVRPARRGSSATLHMRRTVRASMATGGVPLRRAWKRRTRTPRRLVFLLDVSGSMESYARALARFAHASSSARGSGKVEVFTIGTRLTRISRELSGRDCDRALTEAARSVRDWSGGTRLGACLGEFNDRWGVRGLARGAIVVICSDGWDRGDPERLGEEMARLSRVAREVIWVNPLKATPGYAPLARGMAAALPHVDRFVEGHALASLEYLAQLVSGSAGESRCDRERRRT